MDGGGQAVGNEGEPSGTKPGQKGMHRLIVKDMGKITASGMHGDGGGLYLQVKGSSRSWKFRYRRGLKLTDLGLGPLHSISLAQARRMVKAIPQQLLVDADLSGARRRKGSTRRPRGGVCAQAPHVLFGTERRECAGSTSRLISK